MNAITILPPQIRSTSGGTEVIFVARTPDGDARVRVAHSLADPPAIPPGMLGDAAMALFLLPAMRLAVPLEIQSPVSAGLLERAAVLQEIFGNWYPETFKAAVTVRAPVAAASTPGNARGCFFSGGVDSFFSVLKHRATLDRLVFVHGFDLPLSKTALRQEVASRLRAAAETLKLPLLEVETDVREYSDRHLHWGSHFCGAAMAAVAHLLSPWLGEVIIPATTTYAHLEPFGTHLYTDERWAGDALGIRHDGMEARRIDKMRAIATEDAARCHLRVCWENTGGQYNCGRCEKCLRTMANLRALGLLEAFPVFSEPLDLGRLAAMEVDHELIIPFLDETREAASAAGDEALAGVVRRCQLNHEVRILARQLTPLREALPEAPEWIHKAAPRFRDAILEACWSQDPGWTRQELSRHFATDPDAALNLLWKHDRWWLIRRTAFAWLRRRLPRRFRRSEATPPPADSP